MSISSPFIAAEHLLWLVGILVALVPLVSLRADSSPQELLAQGDTKFDGRLFDEATVAYQQAYDSALVAGDVSIQIESLSQLARCRLTQNDFDGCKIWLAKAAGIASEKYPGWARYLGVKGRLEWRENHNDVATVTFKKMHDFAKAQNLPDRYLDAAHMVAITGSPKEQIEWGLRGIEEAEATGNLRWLASMYNNLAGTYSEQKDYEKSYEYYVKAREYHWRFSGEVGKLYADYQIGWILTMLGRYDEALTYLRPSLAWAERLGNDDVQGQACADLGDIAVAKGDKAEGAKMYRRSLGHFKKVGYEESAPDIFKKVEDKLAALGK
jgi:tetratricopeptide (TPR) repeat protein